MELLPVPGSQKEIIKLQDATGHGGGLFSAASTATEAIDFLDTYLK
jgi:hypothetical protein